MHLSEMPWKLTQAIVLGFQELELEHVQTTVVELRNTITRDIEALQGRTMAERLGYSFHCHVRESNFPEVVTGLYKVQWYLEKRILRQIQGNNVRRMSMDNSGYRLEAPSCKIKVLEVFICCTILLWKIINKPV
jgi:hypothetical protein